MAVTSDQLLKFVEKASVVETKFDQDGQVIFQSEPVLEGEALASALKHVAELACHESGIGFAIQQYEDQSGKSKGNLLNFVGPQAN